MKRNLIFLVLTLVGVSLPWRASAGVLALGSQEAAWLDVSNSARYEGMGGAGMAVADDVNALGVNPAGLGQLSNSQLSLMHNDWFQGTALEQGEGAFKLGPGVIGVGVNYLSLGSYSGYSVSGTTLVPTGTFQSSAWLAQVGYGFEVVKELYVGGTAKILQDTIAGDSQTGQAFDAGILWSLGGSGLKIGSSVLNAGSFDGGATPGEWDTGFSYSGTFDNHHSHYLVTGVVSTTFNDFGVGWVAVGGEYWFQNFIALRLGEKFQDETGLSGISGFTMGAGFKLDKLELDYAFVNQSDFGSSNQLSLLTQF